MIFTDELVLLSWINKYEEMMKYSSEVMLAAPPISSFPCSSSAAPALGIHQQQADMQSYCANN